MITIRINNLELKVNPDDSILRAALKNNIYIPHLCAHPDLPASENCQPSNKIYQGTIAYEHNTSQTNASKPGCELCLIKIGGTSQPQRSCATMVRQGMVIETETPELLSLRKDNLAKILANHPHSCLTCAQHEGCSLTQCSSNVPIPERCCPKFGKCELQKVAEYIGIKPETPRYKPEPEQLKIEDDPLFNRNYNLCISCTRCVRACRELRGIDALGYVIKDNKIIVGSNQPALKDSYCKFCGACVEVCPTGALMDKELKSTDRKIDLIPCKYACPAQIDVPEYVRQVKLGNPDKALEVIKEEVPLPTVLGRVCFHPCEEVCRRGEINVDEPIAICGLKRFATENNPLPKSASQFAIYNLNSPVAIVGSGPAGLTAAYYLAKSGYPVTIFEAQSEIGGMMRYAIPAYRLPIETLQADLNSIITCGIQLKTNQRLGRDFTTQSLLQQGFKAIFLAIGAQSSKRIPVKGLPSQNENQANIFWGLDFLKSVRMNKPPKVQGKVLVIGGGNVAIDVALTAKRLGATHVELACLESDTEMPAHDWEIEQAKDEGIIMNCCWGPDEIVIDKTTGKAKGLKFIKCTGVFDEKKCFNPSFDKSCSHQIDADMIILAIGQSPEIKSLESTGLEFTPAKTLKVDEGTLQTNQAGIFAGGEIVHNPGSVINAIADGKKAAANIDKYLNGSAELRTAENEQRTTADKFGRDEEFAYWRREKIPQRSVAERIKDFKQIELGYDSKQGIAEAKRCLQCDIRLHISPIIFPPHKEEFIRMTQENLNNVPEKEGVYQLLDESKNIIMIKGVPNLKQSLLEQLTANSKACYFIQEPDPFYTKRESELIQQYLSRHGKMPEGNDELSDLF